MSLDREQNMMELVKIAIEARLEELTHLTKDADGKSVWMSQDRDLLKGFYLGYDAAVKTALAAISEQTSQELVRGYFDAKIKGHNNKEKQ